MRLKNRDSQNGYTDPIAVRVLDSYSLGTSGPCEIPVALLRQSVRPITGVNATHVDRIVRNYNPKLFGRLTVGARTWTKNGDLMLLDGNHRYSAAIELGFATVPCEVVQIESKEEESRIIVELNRLRVLYAQLDTFAKERDFNPAAKEIDACLAERGLKVGAKRSAETVPCIATVKSIYNRGGYVGLARTVDTANTAWPEDDERFKGEVLAAIDKFFQANPRVEIDMLASRLNATTPHTLLAKGHQRWQSWKGIPENPSKSKVECVAEEIGRVYRRRAA